jgi:hypothetical protein
MTSGPLFLVHASKSRRSGQWDAHDYDVREGSSDGRTIGRIFTPAMAPEGKPWFWTLLHFPSSTGDRGYAETRETAMAALKERWYARS